MALHDDGTIHQTASVQVVDSLKIAVPCRVHCALFETASNREVHRKQQLSSKTELAQIQAQTVKGYLELRINNCVNESSRS